MASDSLAEKLAQTLGHSSRARSSASPDRPVFLILCASEVRVFKTRVAALLSTSLSRDLFHEHNGLDGAAVGLEQEDPVVSPLEF